MNDQLKEAEEYLGYAEKNAQNDDIQIVQAMLGGLPTQNKT